MREIYSVGIDVGGSSLKCGLVNEKGTIVYSFVMPLSEVYSADEVIALINAAIRKCVSHTTERVLGVGLGFPGIVFDDFVIGGADNLPEFKNIPIGKIITESTGLPVVVDNDANMMAWGEKSFGAGRHVSDAVFLTVGTGIGGGLIIRNELYGGYKNHGTEIGHMILQLNGNSCSCGAKGCFEAYASVSALIRDYKELTGKSANGKHIVEAYHKNESEAVEVLHKHFDYMAAGITGLVNLFSPQKVIVGGGISESGEFYIREIRNRVASMAMPDTIKNTQILRAELGNNAGLLGCAANVFSNFKY
ncbi:ROK family protein [Pseudopedobacter beijingensis]|uniref:ROK family protein n=1 Tax=Pseudopedobacter beijingensis TaxID=1207056 RepID=A0ABW4IEJ5_9SPHI